MKVVVLYRPSSEEARSIETFVHDFKQRYSSVRVEMVDADTREGRATADLYDVMSFPAILVQADDGIVQQLWVGAALPLIDEVASYFVG